MRDQILEILQDINPDVDYETEEALVDDGILDSFDIVTLVGELSSEFDVKITVLHLIPENFNSLDRITSLIEKLKEA